jgi:hypothetical protein
MLKEEKMPPSPGMEARSRPQFALLPFFFISVLYAISLTPHVREHATLRWSYWTATAILLLWQFLLYLSARRRRELQVDVVLRREHYVQAFVQFTIYMYWGWYWRNVYSELPLIFSQLAFAYAFDMLLNWTHRGKWTLGFGPFPIVLSTNFFIWFRDEWFYLQFAMIAVILLAKQFIRWTCDGQSTHIFNPAAFALSIASLVLIFTGRTDITWAQEIVTTLDYPPNIYLLIFVLGLNAMFFFRVTPVAATTAIMLVTLGTLYFKATGVYYFIDSEIPIAVFLGLHLLITDPATSPRSFWGRVVFGLLYAGSIYTLYGILWWAGVPTFYDKILCVPLLNLTARAIDKAVEGPGLLRRLIPQFNLNPKQLNVAFMSIWIVFFLTVRAFGMFGDTHEGHRVPFWESACKNGLRGGCETLALIESTYCAAGSGWACNQLGLSVTTGKTTNRAALEPAVYFDRACDLGFPAGCWNAQTIASGKTAELRTEPPLFADLKLILQDGNGVLLDRPVVEMYAIACEQDWAGGCSNAGMAYLRGTNTSPDHAKAARAFEKGCSLGEPTACANLGLMYRRGDGVKADGRQALSFLSRACDLGMSQACGWLVQEQNRSQEQSY